MQRSLVLFGLLLVVACGSSSSPNGRPEGDSDEQTGGDPVSGGDADVDPVPVGDDAPTDEDPVPPTYPLAGFGTITGACPLLSADALADGASRVVTASLDLGAGFNATTDTSALTAGAQAVLAAGTGSSVNSEAFAMELLARCDGASLHALESAITYDAASAKADFSVTQAGSTVGVSVTRGFAFPLTEELTVASATTLLTSKAEDIIEANASVSTADRWSKQALVVMAIDATAAANLATAWAGLSAELRANTILYIVTTDGTDTNIYLAN